MINQSQSGLIKSKNILKNLKEIKIIEFDHTDVVRHPCFKNYPRLSVKKAQMIKVNVVSNNNLWKRYLKRPADHINRNIKKLNKRIII